MVISVEQLQHEATDPSIAVGSILQRAILIANERKDQRFVDWARRELGGHSTADKDAQYRYLKGQYVVITSDGRTLPIVWNDDDAKMKSRFLTLPLVEIETLLAGSGDTFAVTVNVDPRTLTTMDLEPCDRIGFSVTRGTLSGCLHAVRQRILDWTMTLAAPPQRPQQIRRSIMRVIDRLQGNSSNYPEDSAIADEMKLSVEEVRGHLGILEREGRIKLNKTMWGHSAGLDPTQRQLFRESLDCEPDGSQVQVMTIDLPEPTLNPDTYDRILKIINDTGTEIERHPSIYEGKDEETLRDHFLMVLSPHFSSVTGETFNKAGKTDILIRHECKNIFVAECGIWKGAKQFQGKIDQLLSYLTWRDSKTALICFVHNKEFGTVVETIKKEIPSHPCYVKEHSPVDEAWLRYEFTLKDDPSRSVRVAVLCFHYP